MLKAGDTDLGCNIVNKTINALPADPVPTCELSKANMTAENMDGLDITQNTTYYDMATAAEGVTSSAADGSCKSSSGSNTPDVGLSKDSNSGSVTSEGSYRRAVAYTPEISRAKTQTATPIANIAMPSPDSVNNNINKKKTLNEAKNTPSLSRKETTL